MSIGRSVRLFLVDGTPTGILTAEIMNWTGHVMVTPRSRLGEALQRGEALRTGVYFLIGEDVDQPHKSRVYIGEGDSVIERIKSHAKDTSKEFWTHACIVTSKDTNLTKSHVRYLENRLIGLTKESDRAVIANGNEPAVKLLPESDAADMEFFLNQIQTILPVVGFAFLRPKLKKHNKPFSGQIPISEILMLSLDSKKNGVEASAAENDGEITVFSGSTATTKMFSSNSYSSRRQELIDGGILKLTDDGLLYVLTADTSFRSPSEAAAILLNRNSNGRMEWKVVSTGQTLKEWQDKQLDQVMS